MNIMFDKQKCTHVDVNCKMLIVNCKTIIPADLSKIVKNVIIDSEQWGSILHILGSPVLALSVFIGLEQNKH